MKARMQNYQLGEVLDTGSNRVKWEANKNIVVRAVESSDGIHSHLYVWEGSYDPQQFKLNEWGDWTCKPSRGKTKTYSRFIFNTRQDGTANNYGWSVKYKKYQEHKDSRNSSRAQCYESKLNQESISQFNFKYTNKFGNVSGGSTATAFPIDWSVGELTVLEENGFSKELFNSLAREDHINKPLLANSSLFIQNESLNSNHSVLAPNTFKLKNIDKITNFNPLTDTLEIDTDSFGLDSSATFAVGRNKKVVKKQLTKQDFDFLYDQKKGGLYFNENGSNKGFGDGGIIAILKGAPDLTSDNLEFI